MKKAGWIFLALALMGLGVQGAAAEAISAAKEQQIIRDVLSIYEPESLLLQAGETPEIHKCGASIMVEVRHLWSQLSAETRELLKEYVETRPVRQKYYDIPSISIRIHYDTAGADSVDLRHGLDTDGVPMYVKRVAEIFQEVWQKEIVDLGYPTPPADDFYPEGGSADYDIYLTNLSLGFYGLTHGDEIFRDSETGIWRMTSYVELDNDYQGYSLYGPDEWELILAVTAAHEFFHSIQYGIDALEFLESEEDDVSDLWWHEMTATWMEDIVYDDVNDYYYYLDGFFNHPNWALTSQRKVNFEYGACVWPRYLSERFGNQIIHDIWEQCGEKSWLNTVEAWVDQIESRGSTLPEELGRFRLWCYFTGDRYRSFAFSEGEEYPDTVFAFVAQQSQYPVRDSVNRLNEPEYMGAAYLEFVRPAADTAVDFNIQIEHEDFDFWAITGAGLTQHADPELVSTRSITSPLVMEGWLNYESIMVIVTPYNENYSAYKSVGNQKFIYEVAESLQSISGDEIGKPYPNPFSFDEGNGLLRISVNRESKEETEAFFYTAAGELLRGGRNDIEGGKTPYYYEEGSGLTGITFTWDGRNSAGEPVASGIYLCLVRLGDLTSLQKVAVFRR